MNSGTSARALPVKIGPSASQISLDETGDHKAFERVYEKFWNDYQDIYRDSNKQEIDPYFNQVNPVKQLDDTGSLQVAFGMEYSDQSWFRSLTQQLSKGNLAFLYQSKEKVIKALNFYLRYLEETADLTIIMQSIYNFLIQNLLLIQRQLSGKGYFSQVFQKLNRVLRQINFKYGGWIEKQIQSHSLLRFAKNSNLSLWLSHAEELKAQDKGSYICYIEKQGQQKISLQGYLSKNQDYLENDRWRDLFQLNYYYHSIQKSLTFQTDFLSPQEPLIISCLGCTQMFQQQTNIYDPHVSLTKLALLGKIRSLTINADLLREEMCGLLNGGGGVILFDCSIVYLDVIVRGQFLSVSEKHSSKATIKSIVSENIVPLPVEGQEYQISFVPVIWKSMQTSLKKQKNQAVRQYVKDLFVARITVRPRKQRYYELAKAGATWIIIRQHSLVSKKEWISKLSMAQKTYNEFPQSIFDHGNCLPVAVVDNVKQDLEIEGDPQRLFRYASALVVNVRHHSAIKLTLLKYGIECWIDIPFREISYLKGSDAIGIIYHFCPYKTLVQITSFNQDFMFDGKFLVLSEIGYFIKLSSHRKRHIFSRQDMVSLKKWLKLINRRETIQMLEDLAMKQFYIRSQSKNSTLLLFLVLLRHNEKVTMDEPANYSQWKEIDKQLLLKQIYCIEQVQTR